VNCERKVSDLEPVAVPQTESEFGFGTIVSS
jgi:hypothetical protein